MTKNKAKGYFYGPTAENTKVAGKMGNSMESGRIRCQPVKRN